MISIQTASLGMRVSPLRVWRKLCALVMVMDPSTRLLLAAVRNVDLYPCRLPFRDETLKYRFGIRICKSSISDMVS